MPCNLAVSIAKAGVTTPQLLALLTPAIVTQVTFAYLEQQYPGSRPSVLSTSGTVLLLQVGTSQVRIENGSVQVNNIQRNQAQAEELADEIEQLLLQLADNLFQQKLQETLGSLVAQVQTMAVDNEGTVQQATVFSLEL